MEAYLRQILVRAPSFTNTRWGSTSWSLWWRFRWHHRPSAHPRHQWSTAVPSVRTTKPHETKPNQPNQDRWGCFGPVVMWPYGHVGREEEEEEGGVRWARWVPTRGCP